MSEPTFEFVECPKGELGCPIYGEVDQLKQKLAELAEQVRSDALTGLYNKRHLLASLETEFERTCRTRQPTSLIMLDVDRFKPINDTYGHQVGDQVLVQVARVVGHTIRKIDVACRYGGEEFAVILPATPLLIAAQVAERLRQVIADSSVSLPGGELQVTASLGVSAYLPDMPAVPGQLLERADKQLYLAKRSGRNRVSVEPAAREHTELSAAERQALFGADAP